MKIVGLFTLGELRITLLAEAKITRKAATEMLRRHVSADFGVCSPEDAEMNRAAIESGERIHSAYPIDPDKACAGFGDNCVWIITEPEIQHGLRPYTTILLPEEY